MELVKSVSIVGYLMKSSQSEERMSKYRAVIFDMGGVLMSYVNMPYVTKLLDLLQNDAAACKAWHNLEKGITTVLDENDVFLQFLDKHPDLSEEVHKGMKSQYMASVFENMVEDKNWAVALPNIRKAGFLTAVLTNNAFRDTRRQRSMRLQKAIELHDAVIESCRVGYRKPEKEIYLLAASKLRLEPRECVFVDDLAENCDGARAVGMTAIQENFNDSAGAIKELERLLGRKFL